MKVKSSERKKEEGKKYYAVKRDHYHCVAALLQCISAAQNSFALEVNCLVMLCAIYAKEKSLPNISHSYCMLCCLFRDCQHLSLGEILKDVWRYERIKRFLWVILLFFLSGFPQYFYIYSKKTPQKNWWSHDTWVCILCVLDNALVMCTYQCYA